MTSFSHLFHSENLLTAFLLLHRFTAIRSPLSFERQWRRLLPIAILISLFGPLLVTWDIFTHKYYVHYSDAINTSFTEDGIPDAYVFVIFDPEWAAVSACLFCVVCAGLNIACIVVYRRSKGGQGSMVEERQRRVEFRLTVFAFITFAAQLLMALCMFDIYVSVVINSDFLFFSSYNQTPLVNVCGETCRILSFL